MLKQFEGARLGIFIFIGTILLVLSIFLIGNKEKLFVSTLEIKTYFNQIEGLKSGAPVRLSGYDIGSVSEIKLVDGKTGNVEVKMRIETNLIHFIRLDSFASIETEGLVGKKIVSVTPGSADHEVIRDGGILKSKNPVNIAAIIEQTESTMSYLKNLIKDLSEIITKTNQGEGTIGKLVNDEKLYYSAVQITQTADKSLKEMTGRLTEISDILVDLGKNVKGIINNVDDATADVKNLISNIEKGDGIAGAILTDKKLGDSLKTMITNFTKTSDDMRSATSSLAENMEALKHNWLFKGYFEERGYWNKEQYEKEINTKLEDLKKQNEILDVKIKQLLELEQKFEKKSN
ncbi:MAG: MCE family protein [Ignavibacteriales bacterium]|nr:MCE family protein [Ignavibacteriales bacterium]